MDMRGNQTSLTAAGIAITRAIESEKPADERICYDPYARQFAPGWLYAFTAFFVKNGYAEWRGSGVMGFLVARERYIDDVLLQFLEKGLQQLVILGAGYDSRAYRFEELKGRVKVFEVDHHATQADKLAKLKAIMGQTPVHVTYVRNNSNTQAIQQRLPESGYDPSLKTLFVWQGVTMYLTPKAVDETLRFVVQQSAAGSAIVFDYIYQLALVGVQKRGEVSNMRRYRFLTGEALTFGIEEGKVETFLEQRGFHKVQDINANDLRRAYFTNKNVDRKIASGYGIVVAEV
jgi:methyltransferase (TIGR00027 family)